MSGHGQNVFREAREIARYCIFPERREQLRQRVDECKETFDRFHLSASKLDMEELVARWTRMLLAIDAVGPYVNGPTTNGGKAPVPADMDFGALKASA